ncbi:MAG: alpha-2-macroglobulin family protein [Acidobacteriota bacterium]|nr:MG2 domain-containing protein [Blastocatellia bacterium]MDW8240253.1 alpha-2-macroglobulin family protein [Acidobacteriota bacterium]
MIDSLADTQLPEYERLKADAERRYAEGSYAQAHELYMKADALSLPPDEARWVDFRLADTLWRSEAATETADSTKRDQAREQLEKLIRDVQRDEEKDRLWAEVQESLGDFWWTQPQVRNWSRALIHYQQALDWWAGSSDIPLARQRYLNMVWRMAKPPDAEPYYYGYYGSAVPLEILENALKIAQTDNDKAHAHYLIAMTLRQHSTREQRRRIPEEFEAALKGGKATDWYDDALYHYAEWVASYGRIVEAEDGHLNYEPDFIKALALLRRLTREFREGETRYYDQARREIEEITRPSLGVSVSNIFLPDSEIQYHLSWRNVKRIDLAIYKIDLTRDVQMSGYDANWLGQLTLSGRARIKTWVKETGDKGDHQPGQQNMRLDSKLPTSAYVIEARGGGLTARELILVTDVSVVVKASGRQALVYFCNALDGSPIANGTVTLWEMQEGPRWHKQTKQTDGNGLAVFDVSLSPSYYRNLFASAALGDRQAYSAGYSSRSSREHQPWRIYAFTDRPAYRPNEEVQWKFIARKYNGSVYTTPSNQTIEFEIIDPRGSKVHAGKATLNAFGSAWGSLRLTEAMPLGEYRVTFWNEGRQQHIGYATLFRLEEYKLPEFKVSVHTPEENGKRKSFKLGDKVDVSIQVEYYFGGPVANATVEALVYQEPFYHWWRPPRDFPWFYDEASAEYRSYGRNNQIVKRETLRTDALGKATFTFETPRGAQQDFEYRVEARVTDASRREIIATGAVRVTRQSYYVYLHPKHYLYRPQDKVTVNVKALDANNQPVQAEGTIKLVREYWYEIWVDPMGREVKGDELRRLRESSKIFPPPPQRPGQRPWQPKFRGYQYDEILTRLVKTDPNGEAEFTFTPEREGYYRVSWNSKDKDGAAIKADTTVWVATSASTDLGYRHGGLEIIVDKDTFRVGQKAPVMLSAPTNDRYVLFSIEGEDLYSYQLIHLTGTVKLIEVPIEQKHVPNIFLSAAMVSDRRLFMDVEQVIVPPVEHFLSVEVKSDRQEYQPREEGTLTVTTRDQQGRPVAAEVALSLVDESVFYIQQDYAGDPRQYFYGEKRRQYVQTQSTFQQKSYVKLVEDKDKHLIDEWARRDSEEGELARYDAARVPAGVLGDTSARLVLSKESAELQAGVVQEMLVVEPTMAEARATAMLAPPPGEEPPVQVRSDFRATVVWQPDVITDQNGQATVNVKYPDSTTTWKATARVATSGNQFGIASGTTRTTQPLIVRLQAPRFFVVGDDVTLSAVINNNTDEDMTVATSWEINGSAVNVLDAVSRQPQPQRVKVAAHGEARVDWLVKVLNAGAVSIKVTGRSQKYADAMEKSYIAYEHGIEKFVARSGKTRGDDVTVRLDIPRERKPDSTTLTVQVTPSMAAMMLDALPYLIDYPYGCTEQTMSRFLPVAISAKTLNDLGLKPEVVMGKIFGGIEQSFAQKTQPEGKRDLRELDDMIKKGLERLYDMQHNDGGWGWWKEGDSDHFMTAYVVWGLTLARQGGMNIKESALERGAEYLIKEIVEQENQYDMQAWMLHALAAYHVSSRPAGVGQFQAKAFENLWTNRDRLNAYTRALLALSAHYFGYADRARTLVRNLENGVKLDRAPDTSVIQRGGESAQDTVIGTAHWGRDGIYWRWSDGAVESTAFALRALLAIDPQNKLIEPVMNWLVKNRRGAQWSNTRDTAIVVLTLSEYLRQSGELNPSLEYELFVNGRSIASRRLTAEDALSAPSQFAIDRELIRDGANEIRILRKSGRGPIYFAAQAKFFSLEEPLTPAGNEIFVNRQYYRLVGRPTLLKGYVYDRLPLSDGDSVTSGDRIEVVMTIEAKNDYEYLVFEDLKPAGLEAVQIRSGEKLYAHELKSGAVERQMQAASGAREQAVSSDWQTVSDYTRRRRWVYQELRDRKVALFIDKLPQGVWQIRYDLRAEVPGQFHALPVLAHAMYVPEIRANSAEVRIRVEDQK